MHTAGFDTDFEAETGRIITGETTGGLPRRGLTRWEGLPRGSARHTVRPATRFWAVQSMVRLVARKTRTY